MFLLAITFEVNQFVVQGHQKNRFEQKKRTKKTHAVLLELNAQPYVNVVSMQIPSKTGGDNCIEGSYVFL